MSVCLCESVCDVGCVCLYFCLFVCVCVMCVSDFGRVGVSVIRGLNVE